MAESASRPGGPWRLAARSPLRALTAGEGPPVVLFHGFAMRPEIYAGTARSLVARGRSVLCPDLFSVSRPWAAGGVVGAAAEVIERLGFGRALMIAHSFGGGIQLDLAVERPDLPAGLVFADTIGVSRQMRLAREALHPTTLVRLASPGAVTSFAGNLLTHPDLVAQAAWWGFASDRRHHAATVRKLGLPTHVVWAERDTLLSHQEGRVFARSLGAGFSLLRAEEGRGPVDHDAMFRHPEQFVGHLARIGALPAGRDNIASRPAASQP